MPQRRWRAQWPAARWKSGRAKTSCSFLPRLRSGTALPQTEPVHQIVQRWPADAQELCGLGQIAIHAREHVDDGAFLRFVASLAQVQHSRVAVRRSKTDVGSADLLS